NHFVVKHFLSPRAASRAFGAYLPKFNKTRTYQIVESSATHCRVRIGVVAKGLIPADRSAELNWKAFFDGCVLATTGQNGKVDQIKSVYDGDEYSEFIIGWKNPLFSFPTLLAAAIPVTALSALVHFGLKHAPPYLVFGGLITVNLAMGCIFFSYKYVTKGKM